MAALKQTFTEVREHGPMLAVMEVCWLGFRHP